MIISNLDHLQAIDNNNESKELSGGEYYYSLSSYVSIDGNRAIADASADASGDDTFTRTYTSAYTDDYYSSSSSSSDAATGPYYY